MEPQVLSNHDATVFVSYAVYGLITILLAIVAYFLAKVLNKVEKTWEKVVHLDLSFAHFSDDVAFVRHSRNDLEDKMETIVILKRDQLSIWKQIDELKAKVEAPH